ncbi:MULTISPECIES: YdcF family protein [Mannheimia]|uniref:YdcF family protein n=1 Tax=Mannheimia pernigra TaxID=111844 RepID=A0A7H8UWW7_9PAST|nr:MULTISPECIES: YdcF family protein [Mannheimia]QHB18358.1 YdcF family protein [Mannheimia pernigra]QLB41153.1 YdcF family protein [Mannheimia pernigra]QLB43083.1 YdcF family protein [Mannheimia pernigra]QLB45172.1 YdcF family protein [Mannheimia pernigra]QTM01500.1 YdcF family protein [Mannheimia sp. ZY171111]
MFELIKLITAIILPPFNIILLWLLALILFAVGYKYPAYFFALLGMLILYIFSIPYTSQKLGNSLLEGEEPTIESYKNAQAIVVLGGGLRDSQELFGKLAITGTPLERMRYAAYLHKETGLPLLVTGSAPNGTSEAKVMASEFKMFFNIETKWLENKAKTTKENAIFSREILEKENINHIILVTNQWHMKRAEMLFTQQGFKVLPASVGSGDTPNHYKLTFMHFIPQASAMNSNMLALKEWIGYWKEK